jgi:signal transduction histidine kinase
VGAIDHSLYHELLQQQLASAGIDPSISLPPQLTSLLQTISASYATYDQTVQHRTDQLIASTSRAYSFLDSIHKGFMMSDTSGEVVLTNDSLRAIVVAKAGTALSADATLSIDVIDALFHPDLEIKAIVKQCLQSGNPIEYNEINFGTRILRLNFAPLMSGSDTTAQQLLGVVVLVEDITEQKVLERSKDEFLSIASHELRTPLTAIRGNASLIRKHYAASLNNPDLVEMIDDIHEGSVRLIGIVNDFLDVAAIEQGKIKMAPAEFKLNEVIAEVVHELENLCAEKNIKLISDSSVEAAPEIIADRQRIKQVIINLVGNAVKFTDEGSITISTTTDEHFVYTIVTDTGRGMSDENQKLLFRKFQQAGSSLLTRDTTKGTGLGLYISKLIVELSGGGIELQSSVEGKGSAFSFSLPIEAATSTDMV